MLSLFLPRLCSGVFKAHPSWCLRSLSFSQRLNLHFKANILGYTIWWTIKHATLIPTCYPFTGMNFWMTVKLIFTSKWLSASLTFKRTFSMIESITEMQDILLSWSVFTWRFRWKMRSNLLLQPSWPQTNSWEILCTSFVCESREPLEKEEKSQWLHGQLKPYN